MSEETREETLARGTASWRLRVEEGRSHHGLGASTDLAGNVQHLVSPIVGHLRLLERDGRDMPLADLPHYIDRLVFVLELAREEDGREAGEVAAGLIEAAGRTRDLAARSALLVASRMVDQTLMEVLRLERRLESLPAAEAALAVAQRDALDGFRLGVLAVLMTLDACTTDQERERALGMFREMESEQPQALVLNEERAHVWTDPEDGTKVVWGNHPPPSAKLHARQVTPWVLVPEEEEAEGE